MTAKTMTYRQYPVRMEWTQTTRLDTTTRADGAVITEDHTAPRETAIVEVQQIADGAVVAVLGSAELACDADWTDEQPWMDAEDEALGQAGLTRANVTEIITPW